jgi:ankyrin repeat protein
MKNAQNGSNLNSLTVNLLRAKSFIIFPLKYSIYFRDISILILMLVGIISLPSHAVESVIAPASTASLKGLLKVAAEGNLAEVKKMLAAGSNPNVATEFGETALMLAAKQCSQQNYLDIMTALLRAKIDAFSKDHANHDALWYASSHGSPTCMGLLISAGLKGEVGQANELFGLLKAVAGNDQKDFKRLVNNRSLHARRTNEGETALMLAANLGYTAFIPSLLKNGSDIASVDKKGRTALHHAAETGQLEAVRLLLNAGANIAAKNNLGGAPLAIAAQKNQLAVVKLLLERGADVNAVDYHHYTALGVAAINGNYAVANELLERGGSSSIRTHTGATLAHGAQFADLTPLKLTLDVDLVNARANNELTPLFGAITANKENNVRYLLSAGADPNARQNEGDTPLMPAVSLAPEIVPVLIAHGANVNASNNSGVTPLMLAARNIQDSSAMKALLKAGANPRMIDDGGLGAIHHAAFSGNVAALAVLIDAGVDIDFTGVNRQTALILAADFDQMAAVDWLLLHGASVDAMLTREQESPLSIALRHGYFPIAERLIKAGANPNHRLANGDSLLLSAARRKNQTEVELLLKAGAATGQVDQKGSTALAFVTYAGNIKIAEALLKAGADPNRPNNSGELPIYSAIQNGHVDIVKLLFEHGARSDISDNKQRTLAHFIPFSRSEEIFRLLTAHGVPLDKPDYLGNTPLHNAIGADRMEAVSSLLNMRVPLNVRNPRTGSTPLAIAAEFNRVEAVRLLLARGVDVELANNLGVTPLSYAASKGHVSLAQLLLDHGAKVEVSDRFGQSPLWQSAKYQHHELAALLLGHGADANSHDLRGQSALHLAAQTGDIRTLDLLLQAHANVDITDNNADTPLIIAAGLGNLESARRLLGAHANPAARNRRGEDAVSIAARNGHAEILKLLTVGGAQ